MDEFVLALKENLTNWGLNIPIHNEYPKETLLEFKNNVLTNKPTLIAFSIIFLFLNLGGIFNGSFILTALITLIFFISIFEFRATIILSDKEIIATNRKGDIDLGTNKIAYEDIINITKTKWRVDIKTKQDNNISFVSDPEKLDDFYTKLQNKVSKLKNNF